MDGALPASGRHYPCLADSGSPQDQTALSGDHANRARPSQLPRPLQCNHAGRALPPSVTYAPPSSSFWPLAAPASSCALALA